MPKSISVFLALLLLAPEAWGAWGSLNTLGSAQNKTSGTNNLVITTSAAAEVGNAIVCVVAANNVGAADAETTEWSVADSAGNSYTRTVEFENAQGAAAAGASSGIHFSKVSTLLASGGTITFTSVTANAAKAASCWEFSIGADSTISEEAQGTLANDGADPGSLNATTPNAAFLRLRAIAGETPSTTALTVTTSFTAITGNQTSGGGAATNMAVRGEFIISTATGAASDPTWVAVDIASTYAALKEAAPPTTAPQIIIAARREMQ